MWVKKKNHVSKPDRLGAWVQIRSWQLISKPEVSPLFQCLCKMDIIGLILQGCWGMRSHICTAQNKLAPSSAFPLPLCLTGSSTSAHLLCQAKEAGGQVSCHCVLLASSTGLESS